jgi:hypothetical protein
VIVDRGDAVDDLAIGRDELTGGDPYEVTLAQIGGRHFRHPSRVVQPVRDGLGAGLAQRVRLGLAAPLRHRFGEVGKQHREPEP